MNMYAIVMAGGVGARFWPRSREKSPKQLLRIFDEDSIIQTTIKRIKKLIPAEKIFIVTNVVQKELMIEQLPEIPIENFLTEPFGRNTAAAIGLALMHIRKLDSTAVTVVLPADHLIKDVDIFLANLQTAAQFAFDKKGLVTIGIPPTRPETGYGYIQIDQETQVSEAVYRVQCFAEKPNYATALKFIESGDFMWNSGMFIWRVDTILEEMQIYMPELMYSLEQIAAAFGSNDFDEILELQYEQMKSVSIDYGIMEKSKKVYLVKSGFQWSDVGSWEEVFQLSDKDDNKNAFVGDVFSDMTMENFVYSPDKFTAVIGVDNLIVINTKDALLICRRDQAQNVKKVVDYLKQEGKFDLI